MRGYDRTMNRGGRGGRGDWTDPYGGVTGTRYERGRAANRPWVGGYRRGYQGGMGGIDTNHARTAPTRGDYWWIGEHEFDRRGRAPSYDVAYRNFDAQAHPRYSPVSGTYAAMGGRYRYNRPPRPLREDSWFSDWTRWF